MALIKIRNPEYTATNGQEEWIAVNQTDDSINKDSTNAISNKAVATALEEYIKEEALVTLNDIKCTDNAIPIGSEADKEWKTVYASTEANANEIVLRDTAGHIILPNTSPTSSYAAVNKSYVDNKASIKYKQNNLTTPTIILDRNSNDTLTIFPQAIQSLTINFNSSSVLNPNVSYITGIIFITAPDFTAVTFSSSAIIPYTLNIQPNEMWELNIMNNVVLGYKIREVG